MNKTKELLEKLFGKVGKLIYITSEAFISLCFFIMLKIGADNLFNINTNWIILIILSLILNKIPILNIFLATLSLYGGFLVFSNSYLTLFVFILQCTILPAYIILQIKHYINTLKLAILIRKNNH